MCNLPVALFFPAGDSAAEVRRREQRALSICTTCSVRVECRSWADEVEGSVRYLSQLHGVYGAETPLMRSERRKGSGPRSPSRKGERMGTRRDKLVGEGTTLLAEMHRADASAWRFSEIVSLLHTQEEMTLENIGTVFGPSPRTGRPYSKAWVSGWVRVWARYGDSEPSQRPSFWDAVSAPAGGDPIPQRETKAARELDPRSHVRRLVKTVCGPDRWHDLHRERQAELVAEVYDMATALVESELSKMLDLAEAAG